MSIDGANLPFKVDRWDRREFVRTAASLVLLKDWRKTVHGPFRRGLHKANGLVRLSNGTTANGWSLDAIVYEAHWNSTDQVPLALIESGQLGRFSALDPTDGGDTGRDVVSAEWHTS